MPNNPFEHHLRLKRPCENCPFLVDGAIDLAPGRLEGIIEGLLVDDLSTFQCHKTIQSVAESGMRTAPTRRQGTRRCALALRPC